MTYWMVPMPMGNWTVRVMASVLIATDYLLEHVHALGPRCELCFDACGSRAVE